MDKDDHQGIKRLYIGANLSILLLLALAISLLFLWSYRQAAQEYANELQQEILRSKREFIQNAVNRTIQDIEQERALCANKQNEFCTEDAIKERLRARIRALRLKDNGYIWINAVLNYEGGDNYAYRFVHPNLPETEGTMLSTSMQDIKGNFPYLTELEGVKKDGELFFDYWFKKMDSDVIQHKLTFVKLYEPYDWIVATGVYLDDVDELVQSGMVRWRKKVSSDVLNVLVLTGIALFLTWLLSMAVGKRVDSMYAFFLNEVTMREDALRRHKDILEEQVRERTASLQASEEKLKESEERLRLTLEAAQIGIFDWDTVHDTWFASPEFYTMLGYPPKDGMGDRKEWLERAHPDDRTEVNKKIQAVLQGRFNDYQYEARLRHADGAYRWQYARGFGIKRNQEGKVTRILGIQMDITERKRAEEELKAYHDHLEELVKERTAELTIAKDTAEEARRLAETANQAKSAFLANMSHELRTPLNGILGYAHLIKQQANLTPTQKSQVDIIQSSGKHLLTMINEILDLGKIEAQKVEVETVEFNLQLVLHHVYNLTKVSAEAKDLRVSYEEYSPLPAVVRGDERKLTQILLNLLGNAVKYTERGGVKFAVGCAGAADAIDLNRICFEVEDTGVGIPQDQLDEIFEPFTQVGNTWKTAEGTGLGLAITRRLVKLLHGTLTVTSAAGQGSTFRVELPLPAVESRADVAQRPETAIVGYQGERKQILVADDHPVNLAMLVSLLEPLGFAVTTARNGQETVRQALQNPPGLIVLDYLMPVMNGLEAVQELRKHPALQETPIIGMSAAVGNQPEAHAFARACDDFLPKPVDIDQLLDRIQARLRLAWKFVGETAETTAGGGSEIAQIPPPTMLDTLCHHLERGDFREIEQLLRNLDRADPGYGQFCRNIEQYTERYDSRGLLRYLQTIKEEASL